MSNFSTYLETFINSTLNSPESIRQYRSAIKQWVDFLGGDDRVINAAPFDAYRFVGTLKKRDGEASRYNPDDRKLSPVTIKKYIDILRAFYEFLFRTKRAPTNIFTAPHFRLKTTRIDPKRRSEAIPFLYVQIMLNLPGSCSRVGLRDTAMLMLLFGCGIRAGALRILRVSDFRTSIGGNLYVRLTRGKTSSYEVAVPSDYKNAIQRHLEAVVSYSGHEGFAFITFRGVKQEPTLKPLSVSTLQRLFKIYAFEASGGKDYSIHCARATFVTKLVQQGATIREIMSCTGHSTESAAEGYVTKLTGVDEQPNILLSYK